jgi:hypothetical protein
LFRGQGVVWILQGPHTSWIRSKYTPSIDERVNGLLFSLKGSRFEPG